MDTFDRAMCVLAMFGSALLAAMLVFSKQDKPESYTEIVTDVSQARAMMRECVKTLHGTATVQTNWAKDVPDSWVITCEWEKE